MLEETVCSAMVEDKALLMALDLLLFCHLRKMVNTNMNKSRNTRISGSTSYQWSEGQEEPGPMLEFSLPSTFTKLISELDWLE